MFSLDTSYLKVARYRRKSSENEDRQVASLADQTAALNEVAARFHILPSQVVADFGESRSARLSHTRHEFQEMIELIEHGEANAIRTWHPDRLSRNLGDIDTLIGLMEARKLLVIITPQYLFGNTPLEKYILISECTRAKLENDNKGVNVKRGLAGKVRKGWRPGVAKIGYLNNTARERGERDIITDPERFDKVKRLLHLYLTGRYSVRPLGKLANDRFLLRTRQTKRQGGKPLSLSHVYDILTDPFYCGKFWWKNEDGDKELRQGKHPPMITEDEFWKIQALLGKRAVPRPRTRRFAYTALMACGECGAAITAEEKWQIICDICKTKFASENRDRCPKCGTEIGRMEKKTLLHYVYYHCTKQKGLCSQKGIRLEALESQIDQTLARFNISEKYARWALETLKTESLNSAPLDVRAKREVRREQAKLSEELAELNRFIIRQESAGWTLMSKDEALAEKQRLTAQMKRLEPGQNELPQTCDGMDGTASALDYSVHARLWLKEGTLEQRREILAVLGSNLTLKDKKVSIDLRYPLPEIERMIEIAPEMSCTFEPTENADVSRPVADFSIRIPALLPQLNVIRTHFMSTGEPFWKPQCTYAPTIRGAIGRGSTATDLDSILISEGDRGQAGQPAA